jgi:hypothetical protein
MASDDSVYQEIANAIVEQAVGDYRKALRGRGYHGKSAKKVILEVEQFFHSLYFEILTKVDGDYLLEKLQQEYNEERKKNESNIDTSNPLPS